MTRSVSSLSGLSDEDIDDMLRHGAACWPALRGARVLLTGATGWFGTWLLDALVAANRAFGLGLKVVAISRAPNVFAQRHPALHAAPEIEWIAGDVRLWDFAMAGSVSHVIHAATEASAKLNAEEPDRMFDTIVSGTRNALSFAATRDCEGFLLLSSGAVYGAQPAGLARIPESYFGALDVTDPANAYAEGKRAAEQLAAIWHTRRDVPVKIARCFAFVGPHMPFDAHFAIGNFIRDALHGGPIVVKSDGTPLRSYLYLSDLVVWLLATLVDGPVMRAYNVGSDEAISVAALAARCAEQDDRVAVHIAGAHGSSRPDRYVPDTSRIRSELRVDQHVEFDDAMCRTTAWKAGVSEHVLL